MKRERRLLLLHLTVLLSVLAASVVVIMVLEAQPGLHRYAGNEPPTENTMDWKADLYRALEKFNAGDFAGAEELLHGIIQSRPGTPDAWQLLGAVYYRLERFENAEQAFRHLVRQQPFNVAGYNNLSQTLLRLKRPEEALGMALRAAELAPGNGAVLLNVTSLYAQLHNDEEAMRYLRKTLGAGVAPEIIARDRELMHLLERPEFMDSYRKTLPNTPPAPNGIQPVNGDAPPSPDSSATTSGRERLLTGELKLPATAEDAAGQPDEQE